MEEHGVFVANISLKRRPKTVEGTLVEIGGKRFYRISNYDAMPPFLMSLVSDSDHWFFISSNGALTAGRRDPDHALFPYYTDDRIHDSQDQTGSKTIIMVNQDGKRFLWEPFSPRYEGLYNVSRNLYKSVFHNKIIFEEINWDFSMSFSYAWMFSESLGFVRLATLMNLSNRDVEVDILDGVQNILPYGISRRFQLEYSTLADAYKEAELDVETGLAIFKLASIPVDKAEPSEALRATTVWSTGLKSPKRLLSTAQLERFRQGYVVEEETATRGVRGAYFVNAHFSIPAKGKREWYIVAEVNQDAASIIALLRLLRSEKNLHDRILEDVERGTQNLIRIVASADGLQATEDELNTCRHFSNVLFNVMRGGVPDNGYWISRADFISFVSKSNRKVLQKHLSFLNSFPEKFTLNYLRSTVREQNDPDLERLAYEYLPLTFSRRHGDPSRPWNMFSIEVKDEYGRKILNYQGNWRDIFQNWEALALSFPEYIENMIFKFVDAITPDGYNPYRVTREGFEWEVPDPRDPWSYVGYWGDHQVIYLLRLLEASRRYHPGLIAKLSTRRLFAYANIPYRIKPYEDMLKDPRKTIEFDFTLNQEIQKKVSMIGADGKLVQDENGEIYHVNLIEKLLVILLAKLSNYVPEAGIWMNTQRPEWNDANNALVGYGVSVVTLCYLRRFLAFCKDLFREIEEREISISLEVGEFFRDIYDALKRHLNLLGKPMSDKDRKRVLDDLGKAGSRYRSRIYAKGFSGAQTTLSIDELQSFCDLALQHIDHSIRANKRDDGLYHSYNLITISNDEIRIRRLYEMLEGQVAVLSSGVLSPEEAVTLLDSLRGSKLYRADQNSYMLYPDRKLPRFLEKNNIPQREVEKSRLLTELLKRGDKRIVVRDVNGGIHFNAAFRNSDVLKGALEALKNEEEYRKLVEEEAGLILEIYEKVFDHQSFTGRSGSFFKYEGLGCIYWHMVSKLLVAVQEVLNKAASMNRDKTLLNRLKTHYYEIREGIGVHKPPSQYGAFPTDPYSHTPSFAGAQQPGMTGQVKEDIISRLGEMGVIVEEGCLKFRTHLINPSEFLKNPRRFLYYDVEGRQQSIELDKDTLVFTICQVPVIVHRFGYARIEITNSDGSRRIINGLDLDAETSSAIFNRTGAIHSLDVFLGME